MRLPDLDRCRDAGLLVLRAGVGLSFVNYGAPKIFGGPAAWEDLGHATRYVGIAFAPTVWGFLASVSEFFGGIGLATGALFRPAAFLLVCTMTVATVQHFGRGDGYAGGAFHSIEMGAACLGLLLTGPGRLSLEELWRRRRTGEGSAPRQNPELARR